MPRCLLWLALAGAVVLVLARPGSAGGAAAASVSAGLAGVFGSVRVSGGIS